MYTLNRIIFDRSAGVTWIRIHAQGSNGREYMCCYPVGFNFTVCADFYCDNGYIRNDDIDPDMFLFFKNVKDDKLNGG